MLRIEEGSELFSYCISKNLAVGILMIFDKIASEMDEAYDDIADFAVNNRQKLNFDLKIYFPDNYPESACLDTFIAFYSLLISEKAYVPTLVMEYAMARIIDDMEMVHNNNLPNTPAKREEFLAKAKKKMGNDETWEKAFPYPYKAAFGLPSRIIKQLRKEWTDYLQNDDPEYVEEGVRDAILAAEYGIRLQYFCFWDSDYELLDEHTPAELRRSEINGQLGILPDDVREYIVPEDWVHDRGFRFLD